MQPKLNIIFLLIFLFIFEGCLKGTPKEKEIVYVDPSSNSNSEYTNNDNIDYANQNIGTKRMVQAREIPNNSSQSYNNPYPDGDLHSESSNNSNVHLQIQVTKNYSDAQNFKKSIRLKEREFIYIKRGEFNKIIIGGISSEKEANSMRDRDYPGAFIVYPSNMENQKKYNSNSNSNNNSNTYQTNNRVESGIGVQLGSFVDKYKAKRLEDNYNGIYNISIKKIMKNGQDLYKVILTGFKNREEAKNETIKQGAGAFIVYN